MLEITFAKWELPDGTFLSRDPTILLVNGPPGLTVIVQMAWLHACTEGRPYCYRGLARVHRVLATGETDHRFLHFTAVPCTHSPRMHTRVDRDFGWTAEHDDLEFGWHGPCCVDPLAGDRDDLHDADVRASSNAGAADDGAAAGGDAA